MTGVEDLELGMRSSPSRGVRTPRSCQELGDFFYRLLGGREADALKALAYQVLEPLQREREMRSPLVPSYRVDLIHDDGADIFEKGSAALSRQQQIE